MKGVAGCGRGGSGGKSGQGVEGVAGELRRRQGRAPDLGVVQVDQPVDHEQVRAQRHLVLLLRVLEVPVEHLVSSK